MGIPDKHLNFFVDVRNLLMTTVQMELGPRKAAAHGVRALGEAAPMNPRPLGRNK